MKYASRNLLEIFSVEMDCSAQADSFHDRGAQCHRNNACVCLCQFHSQWRSLMPPAFLCRKSYVGLFKGNDFM